jgi:hypothetical protein
MTSDSVMGSNTVFRSDRHTENLFGIKPRACGISLFAKEQAAISSKTTAKQG